MSEPKQSSAPDIWQPMSDHDLLSTEADHCIGRLSDMVDVRRALLFRLLAEVHRRRRPDEPVPMILTCPSCGERHVDQGEFATKPHHTHACQHCGMCWRPAVVPTMGVQFLPGFKDEPSSEFDRQLAARREEMRQEPYGPKP